MGDTELDMPWEVGLKLDGSGHSSSCLRCLHCTVSCCVQCSFNLAGYCQYFCIVKLLLLSRGPNLIFAKLKIKFKNQLKINITQVSTLTITSRLVKVRQRFLFLFFF